MPQFNLGILIYYDFNVIFECVKFEHFGVHLDQTIFDVLKTILFGDHLSTIVRARSLTAQEMIFDELFILDHLVFLRAVIFCTHNW